MSLTKTERKVLAKLRERVSLTGMHAHFEQKHIDQLQALLNQNGGAANGDKQREVVRDVLRTYLDSWVLPAFDALLEEGQAADTRAYQLSMWTR